MKLGVFLAPAMGSTQIRANSFHLVEEQMIIVLASQTVWLGCMSCKSDWTVQICVLNADMIASQHIVNTAELNTATS